MERQVYCSSTADVGSGVMFFRHTSILESRKTLLFIHGLGDSGLAFLEAFYHPSLKNFNIIVPDLLGFGKSSSPVNDDYTFESQISRIFHLVEELNLNEIILVGHSMGGDIGTMMCRKDRKHQIRAFVNIEGDLTEGDRFITTEARKAEKGGIFLHWLRHIYPNKIILHDWAEMGAARLRYRKSLFYCNPRAFINSVEEIYKINGNLPNEKFAKIAQSFSEINVPKFYCWGSKSLSKCSRNYLRRSTFPNLRFDGAFHWIMIDFSKIFYELLKDLIHAIQ